MKDMSIVHDYVHHNMRINFFLDFSIYVLRVLFTRGVEYMTFGILMMMMLIMLVMMYFFFEGYLPLHFWVLVY